MEKLLKFGLVGIFNTLITIISFWILLKFGMNYLIANTIAYLIGVANSYYWNKNGCLNLIIKARQCSLNF